MKRGPGGIWYDVAAAERAVEFFPRFLVHVKGPWKGRTFALEPWQKVRIVRPLFGWRRPHSIAHAHPSDCDTLVCEYGRRVYNLLNLLMPRGNTKTTLCAGLLLYGTSADGEPAANNYCMAGDLDQAEDTIFDIAAKMVKNSPSQAFRDQLKVWPSSQRIVDVESESFIEAIAANWGGAVGFIPHFSVMDEYLVQANTKLENAITTGQGKRRQPLFIRASTQGDSADSPVGRLFERVREIDAGVRPPLPNELNVKYEATDKDDWRDVQVWIRVNPGYGTSLQPSFVREQIAKAIDDPNERPTILQYGLDLLPNALAAWMSLEKWDSCATEIIELDDLEGRDCLIAISIRSALDLAAVAVLFPPSQGDEPMRLVTEFYLPDALLKAKAKQDTSPEHAPPYQDWVDKGAVHLVEGQVLDFDEIEQVALSKYGGRFNVREVTCNPRGAMQLIQDLQKEDANVIELVPNFRTMSPAMTELERLVGLGPGAFLHDGNVVMRWMWTKARVRKGTNGEIRPDRERSRGNIEGVLAVASVLNRAIVSTTADDDVGWAAS